MEVLKEKIEAFCTFGCSKACSKLEGLRAFDNINVLEHLTSVFMFHFYFVVRKYRVTIFFFWVICTVNLEFCSSLISQSFNQTKSSKQQVSNFDFSNLSKLISLI